MTDVQLLEEIVRCSETESKVEWAHRWLVLADWYEDQGRLNLARGCRIQSVIQRKPFIHRQYSHASLKWFFYKTFYASNELPLQSVILSQGWIPHDWHPQCDHTNIYHDSSLQVFIWLIRWLSECVHFNPWKMEDFPC